MTNNQPVTIQREVKSRPLLKKQSIETLGKIITLMHGTADERVIIDTALQQFYDALKIKTEKN